MNMMKRFMILVMAAVIVLGGMAITSQEVYSQDKDLKKIRNAVIDRYISDSGKRLKKEKGDYRVDSDDLLDADLVVTDGDAEIYGEVTGTVIAIDGDVYLGQRAMVRGDVIAVSGDIISRSGSVVVGDEIQTSWRNFVERSERRTYSRRVQRDRFKNWWNSEVENNDIDDDVLFRYNRVEGLFLGARFANPNWEDDYFMHMFAEGGYGFKSKDWRYNAGLERGFFDEHKLTVGFKAYDLTDSDDYWRIGKYENWLAALLVREDYFDYYNRRGFTGYISQRIDNIMKFQLEYRSDTFESLENHAHWSLFGGSKKFRPNPMINEGDMRSFHFTTWLDTRNSRYSISHGLFVKFETEYTSPDLDSDFDFERYILDARLYIPLSRYDNLNMRTWFGSSKGSLPVQRAFYLGGLGTLRGLKFKEFAGTSMAMGNIEYIFDPGRILTGPPSWLLEDFKFSFFGDAGVVDMVEVDDFGDMLSSSDWMHNIGVGLMTHDEEFRIDFAWRTDVQGEPMRVTFRLNKTF